jgi:hypothetical protein
MSGRATWRFACASAVGAAHARLAVPCQDASLCDVVPHAGDGPVLIAVVADGAGSANRCELGARLASRVAWREIAAHLGSVAAVAGLDRAFADGVLATVRDELAAQAARDGCELRDYACTLLAAVAGGSGAAFLQVGDGAMVTRAAPGDRDGDGDGDGDETGEEPEYRWVFWPTSFEYENVTVFVTDAHAPRHLCFATAAHPIAELAVFSDGLQRLALDYATRRAHAPFFRAMMAVVRATPAASLAGLRPALEEFLSSERVNQRTDDDKSLVLAVRIPPEPGGEPPPC